MNNPCLNCTQRKLYCHCVCGKHKDYKKAQNFINQAIKRDREYTFVGTEAFYLKRV